MIRGRPILGAIAGILLGLFLAADLVMWKATTLTTPILFGLPAAGLVVGLVMAVWAPLGRRGR
jgi:hypothetical protein